MTTFDELRRIPLFGDLPDDVVLEVAGQGLEKFVPAGEINGREGEPVEHLYVIIEGELRITKEATGGEVVINTYTPGTSFEVRLPVDGAGDVAGAARDLRMEAGA